MASRDISIERRVRVPRWPAANVAPMNKEAMVDTEHNGSRGPRSPCAALTNERPAMVAAMLALFRDVADDIVVAVDSRVDPPRWRPLLDVADTVVASSTPARRSGPDRGCCRCAATTPS